MSSEAIGWAMRQTGLSSSVKFTLVGMCECAHYKTGLIFPSIEHLCEITAQNRKTLISNIAILEERGFIVDSGDRIGRTKQIKVYVPAMPTISGGAQLEAKDKPEIAAAETVPKTEQYRKRNSSVSGLKQSQKRDTEPSREPSIKSPPTPRRGEERVRGALMPKDWKPVPIAELPPEIGALAAQWPKAAYEAEGAAFAQHWRGRGARRADWNALWAARVQARHAAVTRDAKAGVSFGSGTGAADAAPSEPVAAQRREDDRSAELRAMLETTIDPAEYTTWFGPVALVFEDCGLVVVTRSSFWAAEIEKRHRRDIEDALSGLGRGVDWMRFVSERTTAHGKPVGKQAGKAGRRG